MAAELGRLYLSRGTVILLLALPLLVRGEKITAIIDALCNITMLTSVGSMHQEVCGKDSSRLSLWHGYGGVAGYVQDM